VTTTRERIAAEVRAELARQGKRHGFVAEILGLDKGSVSHRLTGRRDFRAEEIVAIAAALGVPASQFLDTAITAA
jgi:transcriptional regulator with XRE-family HTH domain